jgi:peptidoglycan/LPS O-acetylase OafA/YrhL
MGVVMVVAGAGTVLLGAASVPNEGTVTPDVDTEMRFYAVWYVAAGALLLRAVPRVEHEEWTIRLIGAAFFVAACARVLSWIVVGRPHVSAVVLMTLELVLPLVIIPWQTLVRKRSSEEGRG